MVEWLAELGSGMPRQSCLANRTATFACTTTWRSHALWLPVSLRSGVEPLCKKRHEDTQHVFVLLSVHNDAAGYHGLAATAIEALQDQLGSKLEDLDEKAGHVLISRVKPGTPAETTRLYERTGRSRAWKAAELRFAVGDLVECNMGQRADGTKDWRPGVVSLCYPYATDRKYECNLDDGTLGMPLVGHQPAMLQWGSTHSLSPATSLKLQRDRLSRKQRTRPTIRTMSSGHAEPSRRRRRPTRR